MWTVQTEQCLLIQPRYCLKVKTEIHWITYEPVYNKKIRVQ